MPYDVFGAMQAKSCSPEGRKRALPPRRTWRCLTNESMPIMTVGAYRYMSNSEMIDAQPASWRASRIARACAACLDSSPRSVVGRFTRRT